jgi:hypothetical protein
LIGMAKAMVRSQVDFQGPLRFKKHSSQVDEVVKGTDWKRILGRSILRSRFSRVEENEQA